MSNTLRNLGLIVSAGLAVAGCGQQKEPKASFHDAACTEAGFSKEKPGVAMVFEGNALISAEHCFGGQFDANAKAYDKNVQAVELTSVSFKRSNPF